MLLAHCLELCGGLLAHCLQLCGERRAALAHGKQFGPRIFNVDRKGFGSPHCATQLRLQGCDENESIVPFLGQLVLQISFEIIEQVRWPVEHLGRRLKVLIDVIIVQAVKIDLTIALRRKVRRDTICAANRGLWECGLGQNHLRSKSRPVVGGKHLQLKAFDINLQQIDRRRRRRLENSAQRHRLYHVRHDLEPLCRGLFCFVSIAGREACPDNLIEGDASGHIGGRHIHVPVKRALRCQLRKKFRTRLDVDAAPATIVQGLGVVFV